MKEIQPNKKPLKLRYKLLAVLIPAVLVFTLVLNVVNSGYIMSSTRTTLEKTLVETVEITSEHIAERIANNRKLTMLLANRVGLEYEKELRTSYDEQNATELASEIAALGVNYGFLHMMIADMDGYTRTTLHTNLVDANADYYLEIIGGAESYVSDVSVDQGAFFGRYVMNYSAPIHSPSGDLLGVLVCKSDAAELSELVSAVRVGTDGSTFIMDSIGQCIAHKDAETLFSGEAFEQYKNKGEYETLNKLWDKMASSESGYLPYELNGSRIAAFSRINGTNNWSIAVTVSETEFMSDAKNARKTTTWLAFLMVLLVSVLMIFLFRYTTNGIQKVASRLEAMADGDLTAEIITDRACEETYRLSGAAIRLTAVIKELIYDTERTLSELSGGNLMVTPQAIYPGDFAEIKSSMETNLGLLNELIRQISRTSEEVARGSAQMAAGASGLAAGASEQASSLEELFETVSTLAQRTYEIGGLDKTIITETDEEADIADDAERAALTLSRFNAADTLAEKLTIAIRRIADASESIRRISTDIETISSETGMLALNASVEATHAGEAGRGFSVIATEIRALADKSRVSAKDTSAKIDSIGRAVSRGTQTVELTVATIGEMTVSMDQVKSALAQISNIVENIAATAEETAAGSEELSAQADLLKSLVARFRYHTEEAGY